MVGLTLFYGFRVILSHASGAEARIPYFGFGASSMSSSPRNRPGRRVPEESGQTGGHTPGSFGLFRGLKS